jgi:hypothetical protein
VLSQATFSLKFCSGPRHDLGAVLSATAVCMWYYCSWLALLLALPVLPQVEAPDDPGSRIREYMRRTVARRLGSGAKVPAGRGSISAELGHLLSNLASFTVASTSWVSRPSSCPRNLSCSAPQLPLIRTVATSAATEVTH